MAFCVKVVRIPKQIGLPAMRKNVIDIGGPSPTRQAIAATGAAWL
jgi:hypothetical protein